MTSEIEHDLRAASDGLLATLEQLEQLETEKRTLAPDSDRFQKLAREIERLAVIVLAESQTQQRIGVRFKELNTREDIVVDPIDEMVPTRDVAVILGEWRVAERDLAAADADTAEHAQAAAEVKRLRAEYQRAYAAQSQTKSDRS